MQLHVANHPLIDHKMTLLRDERTSSPVFRELVSELVNLLTYEATRTLHVEPVEIRTPVGPTTGSRCAEPLPLAVPIIRAGLGMLDGLVRVLPTAEVGFLGMVRDEETLEPVTYAERLPDSLAGRQCFVLDPMLATGGSASKAIDEVKERGAKNIRLVCLIGVPEGVALVQRNHPDVDIYLAAMDDHLNEKGYIVPGLGDAGDRLYGTV